MQLRDGFVVDGFIALARMATRTATEDRQLTILKQEMADRLVANARREQPQGICDGRPLKPLASRIATGAYQPDQSNGTITPKS